LINGRGEVFEASIHVSECITTSARNCPAHSLSALRHTTACICGATGACTVPTRTHTHIKDRMRLKAEFHNGKKCYISHILRSTNRALSASNRCMIWNNAPWHPCSNHRKWTNTSAQYSWCFSRPVYSTPYPRVRPSARDVTRRTCIGRWSRRSDR
jgi:hypothetical protein